MKCGLRNILFGMVCVHNQVESKSIEFIFNLAENNLDILLLLSMHKFRSTQLNLLVIAISNVQSIFIAFIGKHKIWSWKWIPKFGKES